MRSITLTELSFDNIEYWPIGVKIFVLITSCITCALLAYYIDISTQLNALQSAYKLELQLKHELATTQQQTPNLNHYKKQLSNLQQQYTALLTRIAKPTEVTTIIDNFGKTAAQDGVEVKLVKPLAMLRNDFLPAVPLQVSVVGTYSQLLNFIRRITLYDRIITIQDLTMEPTPALQQLQCDFIAKIYCYITATSEKNA